MKQLREIFNPFSRKLFFGILVLISSLGAFVYLFEFVLGESVTGQVQNIIISIVIVVTSIVLTLIVKQGLYYLNTDDDLTDHQQELSYRFTQITVYLSGMFLLVTTWGIDLSNVLLGAGVLSILVGFAARQALSSVLAGIIIMSTNMFRVNDWISFEDKFGRIRKITFFNTHMRSSQGETHIIPNDSLTSKNVTNMSDQGRYRNDFLVGVDYKSDIDTVLDVCDDELRQLKESEHQRHIQMVGFQETSIKEFTDSSIELAIKVWIKNPSPYLINQTQTIVLQRLHERFEQEGIMIPFPQMTISNRTETEIDSQSKKHDSQTTGK